MKHIASLSAGWCTAVALGAQVAWADIAPHPYAAIAGRNVFGLRTPPSVRPEPPAPLVRVRLGGIVTIGGRRALLTLHQPTNPAGPAQAVGCVLKVGQRAGPVRLLDIDEVGGRVKVDNAGTLQVLEFAPMQTVPAPPELPTAPVRAAFAR